MPRGKRAETVPPKKTGRGKTLNAKAAQQEAAEAAAAKAQDQTLPMPTVNDVQNLARRCKSMQKQARETSGQIGEMIAKAVENKSLDRTAFAIARRLDNMSAEKVRVTYHHLLRYLDDLGVVARATAQADMFDGDGDGDDADGAEGEPVAETSAGNVVRPGNFVEGQRRRNGANQDRSSTPLPPEKNFSGGVREVGEAAGA